MTGKLELPIRGSNEEQETKEVSDVHGGLKQLVQVVHPLHEFERDADQEEFLQLVDDVTVGANPYRDGREQAARGDNDVEHVPAVGAETPPAEPVEAHDDVHHVHDGDEEEKVICKVWGLLADRKQ